MRTAILRSGILLTLTALGASAATAQTELYFATGVDSTGWAQAQSNADGHVLIESPQYPRGLWLHLVDEAGDALVGIQVEYQGRPDSLVAIRCVDPAAEVQETLVWTRAEGAPLLLTLKSSESTDLPVGLVSIDWRIDPTAEALLEPITETRQINWEEVAALLQERGQGQAGRVAVRIGSSTTTTTWAVGVDHPEAIETLLIHLQQPYQPTGISLGERTDLYVQVFRRDFALQEGVILYLPLFADANLERKVREELGRPQGRLTSETVIFLTELWAIDEAIHNLAGIEHLTALQTLDLYGNQIVDITPLNQLNNLKRLVLSDNQIVDITPLNQLDNLKQLMLYGNQIVDITPLNQLINLNTLSLPYNQIDDITPLNQLNNLQTLELGGNQIVDITPLNQLDNLKQLGLSDNQIVDITPLNQLINLNTLSLPYNQIDDITPLNQLNNLQTLELGGNQIVDITPLNQLDNLKQLGLSDNQIVDITPLNQLINLNTLSLPYNQIDDITPLNQLNNLQRLFLSHNQIDDITPLNQLNNLQRLELSYNQIDDITPLNQLDKLQYLNLNSNRIEDLTPLIDNPRLSEGDAVYLTGNPLSAQALNEHIPALKARGVIVSY